MPLRWSAPLALALALACSPSEPDNHQRDANAPARVDLTDYELACEVDDDCALVKPDVCSHCGCASEPISQHELARFQHERDAVVCPEHNPDKEIVCGSCPGFRARCQQRRCAAEMY